MSDLIHISIGAAGATALLGYAVVFFALVLLLGVVSLMGLFTAPKKPAEKAVGGIPAPGRSAPVLVTENLAPLAPGTAGEVKLYDTDPRTAAMLMAIVADELQTPLNELRFISIREIKEEDQ